jgi:DNA-binding protein H-NS
MPLCNRSGKSKRTRRTLIMVRSKVGISGQDLIESKPKKTRQGSGKNTKYAASSRNNKRKVYRGQGR